MLFRSVEATRAERSASRPGDELVPDSDVVMDRVFTVNAAPDLVWPVVRPAR